MKRAMLAAMLCSLLASASAVDAADMPHVTVMWAGDLKRQCHAIQTTTDYAMCFSFLSAILEIAYNKAAPYGFSVCLPKSVTIRKAVTRVQLWLEKQPDEDYRPATYVATAALSASFPCPPRAR